MPQKKTRKSSPKHKPKPKPKTKNNRKVFYRTPTPYPFSPVSPVSPFGQINSSISSSSALMKAVSRDGEHWHVDTDVNGEKKHANLTNSQIMGILAYPAAKQDLKTQLLEELRNISAQPQHQPEPIRIAPNFGTPIIRMYGPLEEPKIEYIYKRGCSNKPIMLNKLSPLHEAKIIPEMDGEVIHLNPMHLHTNRRSVLRKHKAMKGKTKGKGKGKSKK
jgi:hypothetical protein